MEDAGATSADGERREGEGGGVGCGGGGGKRETGGGMEGERGADEGKAMRKEEEKEDAQQGEGKREKEEEDEGDKRNEDDQRRMREQEEEEARQEAIGREMESQRHTEMHRAGAWKGGVPGARGGSPVATVLRQRLHPSQALHNFHQEKEEEEECESDLQQVRLFRVKALSVQDVRFRV